MHKIDFSFIQDYIDGKPKDDNVPSINFTKKENDVKKLNNINALNDKELYGIVSDLYNAILDKTVDTNLFKNERFVTALIDICNKTDLTLDQKKQVNSIAYDYITYSHADPNLKEKYIQLVGAVNKNTMPILIAMGLPTKYSVILTACARSDNPFSINVKRTNLALMASNEPMDVQTIIKIYEKILSENFVELFITIMVDVYTLEELESIGSFAKEIYSNILTAIFDILEQMTSDQIQTVVKAYGRFLFYKPHDVRCYFDELSRYDYSRTLSVYDLLKEEQYLVIP